MAILKMTRQEYETKYGQAPQVGTAPTAVAPVEPKKESPLAPLANKIEKRVTTGVADYKASQGKDATINPIESGVRLAGGAMGIANDVIGEAVGGVAKVANAATGGIAGNLLKAVGNSPLGVMGVQAIQSGVNKWEEFEQKYPRVAQDLAIIPEAASLIGNFYGGGVSKQGVQTGVKSAVTVAKDAVATGAVKQAEKVALDVRKSAIADATPAYNSKMIKESSVDGVPRVIEGKGLLGTRQVTTKPLEREAGAELAKVPGYDPKMTNMQKYQLARTETINKAKTLEKDIIKERVVVPKKEIVNMVTKATKEAAEESLLFAKSDPVLANYTRIIKRAAEQNDGTLGGVLKIRKEMDAAYKNARGKLAYGSDKITALDDIHTASRDALNKYLIDHATNVDVKRALKEQWDLHRASDVLLKKAEMEGGSKIEQLITKHPIVAKAVQAGADVVKMGTGVRILTP